MKTLKFAIPALLGLCLLATAAPVKTFPVAWKFKGTNPPPEKILFFHATSLSTPTNAWEVVKIIDGFNPQPPVNGHPDLVLPPESGGQYWRGVYYYLSSGTWTTNNLVPVTSTSFDIDPTGSHFFMLASSNSFEGCGPFSNAVGNHGPPGGADIYRP